MTQTPSIQDEMPKAYEPSKVEQKWYQFWLDKGYFKPRIDPTKKPFVIIMPPPNVTGELHIGHALTAVLEDTMTRWHRMKGEPTLWLPGVDHAGIAAQVVVEQLLLAEAGYPNGFKTQIVVTEPYFDLVSMIKDYWANIGVDLEIKVVSLTELMTIADGMNYGQMLCVPGQAGFPNSVVINLRTDKQPFNDMRVRQALSMAIDRPTILRSSSGGYADIVLNSEEGLPVEDNPEYNPTRAKQLLAEGGLGRHQLGRDKFLEWMWRWAKSTRHTITEQHQRLGVSCDWSRERFTLDEGPSRAVRTAFIRLYHKGLVYRGERIINWCPRCATALSDLEVEHKEVMGHLYYVRYPLTGSEEDFITVATTRPETILGDTAVAVNPGDERFRTRLGKKVILPAVNRVIPIVADEAVDPGFGTGAVKVTPAHDPVDFDMAQRQGLPLISILNSDATMNENAGPYVGLDRFACRKAILADLERDGLLVKVEPYTHSVGHCQRCQTVIEPIASKQWFINTKSLAQPAIDAVLDGRITIIPSRFTKVYLNWMENIRDWCISRQLWWGHRIPVWYCQECGELTVSVEDAKACSHCGSANIEQDPDVLDTWFSSALWTHSTLGWPDDTEDLRYFYPTTVMETGYDILFFWVARMIMMGLEDTGDIPFHTVYLHGLIRDERGEKMSKIKGNVLNPIDTLEEYGTDALRFALSSGTAPGNDSKLTPSRLEAGRNFANKLWNATRFVLRSIEPDRTALEIQRDLLPTEDRWILSRLSRTISNVTSLMEDFQLGEAQRQIYDFLWGEFCDWYIELAKIRLRPTTREVLSPIPVLLHVLETSLRLLHPYMPFVTEELWQNLKRRLPPDWQASESIMVAPYPEADAKAVDPEAERVMESIIEIIRSIRNARAQYNVESARWIEAQIYGGKLTPAIIPYSQAIETLARARPVTFLDTREEGPPGENVLVLVLKETEVVIPMETMVNLEAERKRLGKEIEQNQAEVTRLEARLNDRAFLTKAPAAIVDKERDKLGVVKDKLERLKQQLTRLQA